MVRSEINFGRNLNILRSRNNMSQKELAEKIHVTRQTISIWERGEGKPDIYYVNDICKLFNVSMDEMVYGNAMYPKTHEIYEQDYAYDEIDYIKDIREKGFYTIIDDDIHKFFPIIRIDFTRIMVIALALKKNKYAVIEVFNNGFSVYIDTDEAAIKFQHVLYDIIDSFIHCNNDFIEAKSRLISDDVSDVKCRIIDMVMAEIWGKPISEYKYYWVDSCENPRGYADTKQECDKQARTQQCIPYEILSMV